MRFLFGAGRPCLDFTRTVRERRGATAEGLALPADLERWVEEAKLPVRLDAERLSTMDVEAARRLREAIYAVVRARAAGEAPSSADVQLLNAHAEHAPPAPRLLPGANGVEWEAGDPLRAVLALLARDAIDLAASPAIARVRECEDPRCTSLFLDTSRPGNRRWCSAMPCANRQKVRAYRARRGSGSGGGDASPDAER